MTNPAWVFELRTITPVQNYRDLNRLFFERAADIGYSQEELQELQALFAKNKGDLHVMARSSEGKAEIVRRGLYKPTLCPGAVDILSWLDGDETMSYRPVRIFTKGGIEIVTAIIEASDLKYVVKPSQVISVSTDIFKAHDRTTPECYAELSDKMRQLGGGKTGEREDFSVYVTDNPIEGNACYRGANARVYLVDFEKKFKPEEKALPGLIERFSLDDVMQRP